MVKKTAEEKLQEAAEFVEAGADEIFEKYAAADALVESAEQYLDRHPGEAHGSISVNDPLVLEQDISGLIAEATQQADQSSQQAAALAEAARQYVDRHQAAHGSISVNDPLVLEQDISGLIAEATQQADQSSQQAAALTEAARQEWNKVFFLIKALKPRMASDEALRSSKLGALLNKLP